VEGQGAMPSVARLHRGLLAIAKINNPYANA